MQHWFVYYKLDASAADELAERVHRMQDEVAATSGVRTRLMRRADVDGRLATLLEIYEGVSQPAAFEAILSAALARANLPATLIAQRRTERFAEL